MSSAQLDNDFGVDEAGGSNDGLWRFRCTTMGDDERAIESHLDQWAKAGWELISANAVQWLEIGTTHTHATSTTFSSSALRHFFYWRKRVGG
jgi:hypothetical protein